MTSKPTKNTMSPSMSPKASELRETIDIAKIFTTFYYKAKDEKLESNPTTPISIVETEAFEEAMQLIEAHAADAVRLARIEEAHNIRIDLGNVRFAAQASLKPFNIVGIDECIDSVNSRIKELNQGEGK